MENDGPIRDVRWFDSPIRNGDFSDITLPEDIWRKHLQYSIPQVLVKNWDLQDWEGISCVISRMHLRFLVESMYESIGRLPIDVQQKKGWQFHAAWSTRVVSCFATKWPGLLAVEPVFPWSKRSESLEVNIC